MKIIARTENKYLAEISVDGVANLLGFDSAHKDEFRQEVRSNGDTLTGLEIEVEKMYDTALMLRGLNKGDIKRASDYIKSAQQDLDTLAEVVNKMTLFETLKDA